MNLARIPKQRIEELLASSGLALIGITSAQPLECELEHLKQWQEAGKAAGMEYMQRDPALLSDPSNLLPEALSVVMVAVRYDTTARPTLRSNFGRVARYAWGRDYHEVLRQRLQNFASELTKQYGEVPLRIFSDSVPLMERGFARRAGLGFVGKNTMLIRPKIGSFFFLAEIILGAEIVEVGAINSEGGCGSCTRCSQSCPTGALDEPYTLDARRCISYLTIEKRGAFEVWEREALGDWVFGCDICQECCPFNHSALKEEREPELIQLSKRSGVGPELSLAEVLKLRSNSQFEKRFDGTPLLRPRRAGLLRNCAVVAANTGSAECVDTLLECARGDSSPIVRQHCGWAISVLVKKFSARSQAWLEDVLFQLRRDSDDSVRTEAIRLLEN